MKFRRKRVVALVAAAVDPPAVALKPSMLHVDVSPEIYAKRADFEKNPVTVAMTEAAADGTIEMTFTSIGSVRDLQANLRSERTARADAARALADERDAHARTKRSQRYVEDTEGVKRDVTTRDNAIGFALGALLTLDNAISKGKLGRGRVPLPEEVQQGLRAIGKSLKPHAPKFLPSVPLGNLIETAQIRRWTGEEEAREKIAALPPAERAALKAAAETSDDEPDAAA